METVLHMCWVRASLVFDITSANINMIAIDYELLHCWLEHPSKNVPRAVWKQVKDFTSVSISPVEPVCPGCQVGKKPNHLFAANETCTIKFFELVHSDLKCFETESYHRSKYDIIFYDDHMSVSWIKPLWTKDQALLATKEFIICSEPALHLYQRLDVWCRGRIQIKSLWAIDVQPRHPYLWVCILYPTIEWTSWVIYLHSYEQCSGDASSHLPSWFLLGVYCPVCSICIQGLNWRTPHELLFKAPPTISHLHVIGCATYVHLLVDTCGGKLQSKLQLMILWAQHQGMKFMCSKNLRYVKFEQCRLQMGLVFNNTVSRN